MNNALRFIYIIVCVLSKKTGDVKESNIKLQALLLQYIMVNTKTFHRFRFQFLDCMCVQAYILIKV